MAKPIWRSCAGNGSYLPYEIETPEPFIVDDALGVDLGVVNLATTSHGKAYNGNFGTSAIRLPNLSRARMLLFAHPPSFIHHDGSTV